MKPIRILLLTLACCSMVGLATAQSNFVQNGDLETIGTLTYQYGAIDLSSAQGWDICDLHTNPRRRNTITPNLVESANLPSNLTTSYGAYSGYIEQDMSPNAQGWFGLNENGTVPVSIPGPGTYDFSILVGGVGLPGFNPAGFEVALFEKCGGPEVLLVSGTVNPMDDWTSFTTSVTLSAAEASTYDHIIIRIDANYTLGQEAIHFDHVAFGDCTPASGFPLPPSVCEQAPIFIDLSGLNFDPGTLYLNIQDPVPGAPSFVYEYIGPPNAGIIDLNDPNSYSTVLSAFGAAPTVFPFNCTFGGRTYNVTALYSQCGSSVSLTEQVTVNCCPPPCSQVNVDFGKLTTANTCDNLFVSSSTSAPGDPIVSYAWDFGDGTLGSGASLNHSFTSNSVFNVCLTVTTQSGCVETYCKVVKCLNAGDPGRPKGREGMAVAELTFSIYPNPAKEVLYLQHDLTEGAEVLFYNPLGQVVLQQSIKAHGETAALPVANLGAGLYFIKVVQQGKLLYQDKVLIQ